LDNKPKTFHFNVFGYKAYVFLPSEVHANKLVPCSELMIFIGYENNGYCFICHTQENIIFHSTYAIFDEGLFSKYTDSHAKECKLYDKLLDKISSETEPSIPDPSGKDRPAPVPIPHTLVPPIQKNLPTHSPSSSLSYKSTSPLSTPESRKPTVEIKETNDVDSNVEMQLPSLQ